MDFSEIKEMYNKVRTEEKNKIALFRSEERRVGKECM